MIRIQVPQSEVTRPRQHRHFLQARLIYDSNPCVRLNWQPATHTFLVIHLRIRTMRLRTTSRDLATIDFQRVSQSPTVYFVGTSDIVTQVLEFRIAGAHDVQIDEAPISMATVEGTGQHAERIRHVPGMADAAIQQLRLSRIQRSKWIVQGRPKGGYAERDRRPTAVLKNYLSGRSLKRFHPTIFSLNYKNGVQPTNRVTKNFPPPRDKV